MKKEITYEEPIDELITTYLAGNLSSDEIKKLQEWVNASPENKNYFNEIQDIWFSSIGVQFSHDYNKEDAYTRFLNRKEKHFGKEIKTTKTPLRFWLYRAAIVVLFIGFSSLSYWWGKMELQDRFSDMVIEAPLGSRSKIYLPDGSLVWLNAGTKITYSQGYGVHERIVDLTGEAYFEVMKDDKLPFLVKTGELYVQVKGTKFNFKNYQEDEEATVSLINGIVEVTNILKTDDRKVLLPDQKIQLNKKSGEMQLLESNARYSIEWTNGALFFDEELLSDIAKELERSYDVNITIADESLLSYRFYGNFTRRDHSIEDILEMLAYSDKIRYEIKGKDITIYSFSQ